MTKEQFMDRVADMLPELSSLVMDRASKIADSGCVDLASYDDDFRLPKMFMAAMGAEIAWQYKPISMDRKERRIIKNIERFL